MVQTKICHINEKWGHLTIKEQVEDYVAKNGKHFPRFLCECDCKTENPNTTVAVYNDIRKGNVTSCGCVRKQKAYILCKSRIKPMKNNSTLELNIVDDKHKAYGRCKTNNTNKWFYFSMCDYDVIKDYCWGESLTNKNKTYHRLYTNINGKSVTMHTLFGMKNPDHINRNPLDNRRENLDNNVAKNIQFQNRNRQISNTSGCKGVYYKPNENKWEAGISINNERKYLGYYSNKSDAIIARLRAEQKYFDKRAWQQALMEKYGLIGDDEIGRKTL